MQWKQTVKRVAYWTVPAGIQDLARARLRRNSVSRFSLSAEERAILERNRELHNRHLAERCFVLATGPSIKKQDLRLLQGETCISVANFFVHPDFHHIRPRYHCLAPLHPPFTDADGIRWFRDLQPHMAHTTLFLGYSDKRLVDENDLFKDCQVRYLYFGDDWANRSNNDFDLARPLAGCQSVAIMALMVALYLGFREIYLLGVELDEIWCGEYKHFYDNEILRNDLAVNEDGKSITPLIEMFRINYTLWRQFDILRSIAEANNIEILNATQGGALDVYRRVKFEDLFDE